MFVFFFFLSINVFARDIEIYVEDKDLSMPLEGATVILRNGTQFICDKNGIAKVTLPNDTAAILSITYPGYETFRLQIPATDNVSRINRYKVSLQISNIMSGLLQITSKSPSATITEFEVGISTSAASLNLSIPLNRKGGILFMGKVTYWDVMILAAQGLSCIIEDETLDMVNSVSTSPYNSLEKALENALNNENYIDNSIQTKLEIITSFKETLTRREKEIFSLVKNGIANKQIAEQLGVNIRTVENFLSRIYKKHGVKSRQDLQVL